jgi:hypothetical protein
MLQWTYDKGCSQLRVWARCEQFNIVTVYCATEKFTKPQTVVDHLERYKHWELDMRFDTWKV